MSTVITEQTSRRLSETYGTTHKSLVNLSPEERQSAWEDSVSALQNFDLREQGDQIQAMAWVDTLHQIVFAATRTTGSGNGSV